MKLAFVALALLVVGCKKGGGDCASAARNAVAVSKDVLSKLPGMESRYAAVTDAMKARCLEDIWTAEVIACVTAATSEPELGACRDKMTPEQKDKMRAAMMDALGMGGGGGTGGGGDGSGSAMGSGGAAGAAGGGSDGSATSGGSAIGDGSASTSSWPPACVAWEEIVAKAATCDQVPQAARDSLKTTLDVAKRDAPAQPAEKHVDLAAACKASTDAIRAGIGKQCGW